MSKAAKKSFYILMTLLIAALSFSYITFFNFKKAEIDLAAIEKELSHAKSQFQADVQKHKTAMKELKSVVSRMDHKNDELVEQIEKVELEAEEEIAALSEEIGIIADDRDKWKRRIETIQEERDRLLVKIGNLSNRLGNEGGSQIDEVPIDVSRAPFVSPDSGKIVDEQYWANLLKEKTSLQIDIQDLKDKLSTKSISLVETKQKNEDMQLEIDALKSERKEIDAKIEYTTNMIDNVSLELSRTKNDKEFITGRVEKLDSENENLRQEMKKLVSLKNELEKKAESQSADKEPKIIEVPIDVSTAPSESPENGQAVDQQYWANLLEEKASLQRNIQNFEEELSAKSIALVEIRQGNEGMRSEVDMLNSEKEEIGIKVQHMANMIDNISLELARTKNDKKSIFNRVERLNEENKDLRRKMKKLVSMKNMLEKSIIRVTREKDKIRNQLGDTEVLVQSQINEIWDIKDKSDRLARSSKDNVPANEVELLPIVVSPSGSRGNIEAPSFEIAKETLSGVNGQVISINEPNHFVIVDMGKKSGVHLGDNLNVYRDSKHITSVEIIQVREDISAADFNDQGSKIKVGDIIR